MVFPVVIYGFENWTIKKAEHQCFQTVVLEKTLESLQFEISVITFWVKKSCHCTYTSSLPEAKKVMIKLLAGYKT